MLFYYHEESWPGSFEKPNSKSCTDNNNSPVDSSTFTDNSICSQTNICPGNIKFQENDSCPDNNKMTKIMQIGNVVQTTITVGNEGQKHLPRQKQNLFRQHSDKNIYVKAYCTGENIGQPLTIVHTKKFIQTMIIVQITEIVQLIEALE